MLKAGALYYAVFLSFLIALITGFFILYTYFHNFYIDQQLLRDKIIADVNSAINVFCKDPRQFNYETTTQWQVEENSNVMVNITRKQWGAYDLINATAKIKHFQYQKLAITGDDMSQKEQYALYLADKKKYLSISGSTKLNGDCYLPKLGIKRAYIEGQGYRNNKLVYGSIQESNSGLPKKTNTVDNWIEPYFSKNYPKKDSVVFLSEIGNLNEITNSFKNKILVILTDAQTGFPKIPVKGNVIIHSEQALNIPGNANVKDAIVIAPSVAVGKGFTGSVQIFTKQNIYIQEGCRLRYPSFIGLYADKSLKDANITIENEAMISGGVLVYSSGSGKEEAMIKLNKGATIQGIVFSTGAIQLSGSITGTLFAEKFVLRTASSIYENHLLNCTIDRQSLNKEFAAPFIIDDMVNQKLIKWVN